VNVWRRLSLLSGRREKSASHGSCLGAPSFPANAPPPSKWRGSCGPPSHAERRPSPYPSTLRTRSDIRARSLSLDSTAAVTPPVHSHAAGPDRQDKAKRLHFQAVGDFQSYPAPSSLAQCSRATVRLSVPRRDHSRPNCFLRKRVPVCPIRFVALVVTVLLHRTAAVLASRLASKIASANHRSRPKALFLLLRTGGEWPIAAVLDRWSPSSRVRLAAGLDARAGEAESKTVRRLLHPEDAIAWLVDRAMLRGAEAERQDGSGVGRVDHAVVPQARR
jgi:hypothetical protein